MATSQLNINSNNGEQIGSDNFQYEGMLFKRQRGRSLKKGNGNRIKLKFQPRFCVLSNNGFTYKPKKSDKFKVKDIFPIGRIKFVKDVASDVFSEQSLSGIDDQHCFQFGDEQEVLYFIAPTEKEKKSWMSMLEQAARINGNEMLKTYHRGAYGSKRPEEWSCCGYCGKNQEGCFSVSDDSMVHPRQPTRKGSHTDELSKTLSQANNKPLRKSHSVGSTGTVASMQWSPGGHESLLTESKPIFSLAITVTATIMSKEKKESGAVVYYYGHCGYLMKRQRGRRLKDGTDRRKLIFERRYCILKSEYFTYMKHENASMDDRQTFSVKRIEFIEDVNKGTFCNTEIDYSCCFQFGDNEEALYFIADTVKEKNEWMSKLKRAAETKNNESLKIYHSGAYGSLQPDEWSCCKRKGQKQMGCIIPDSMEERLRERRLSPPQPIPRSRGGTTDSGKGETPSSIPGTYGSINIMESCPEYSVTHEIIQSLRLSSDCVLNFNGKWLLTGKRNGVVLLWEVTQNGIELASQLPSQSHPCFEVAGQVNSIDTNGEYAAVGSTVVQLVKLTDFALNKRILLHKSMKSMENSEKKRNILALLGRTGKLATAQLHGNTIDIWDISTHKTLITDPCATYQLSKSAEIWSLSASTEGGRVLISVVCLEDGEMTLRILQLESSTQQNIMHTSIIYSCSDPLKGSTPEVTGHTFLLDGRTIALAQGNELKLFDVIHDQATTSETDTFLETAYMHDDKISCLSLGHDHSNVLLGVGLENGTLVVYCYDSRKQHLIQSHIFFNDLSSKSGAVVSSSLLENGMWCVAHKNGSLNVWKESTQDHEKVQQKSALGMELYARGILTKPKIVQPKANEFVDIGCGISISLPQEVAENEIPIEVAFTPYGPGPSKLLGIPDEILVISPILWVCAPQVKRFKESAIIKLPHCFDCKTQEDSDLLTVLKADHNDEISVDEAGQLVMDFKKVDAQFPPNKQYCVISDDHFCLYCTMIHPYSDEELRRVNYCLSILKPKTFSTLETQTIHCILHYDLNGCHKLVNEQIPDGYELIQKRQLQFTAGRYEARMKICIDSTDAARAGWGISLQSDDEILLESVNYNNYRRSKILECSKLTADKSLLYPHTYPPRFILEVSAREMRNSEFMTMEFTGPKKPVKVTIQLLSQVQPRLYGLIKAIEGSGAQIQQKVIQYFNKLMEAPPRETEV